MRGKEEDDNRQGNYDDSGPIPVTGSCDQLQTGVEDLKAIEFSEFAQVPGNEVIQIDIRTDKRQLMETNIMTTSSQSWHSTKPPCLQLICEVVERAF